MRRYIYLSLLVFILAFADFASAQETAMVNGIVPSSQEQNEAEDAIDRDESKSVHEKVNEFVKKIYDNILVLKEKHKELADFDEKALAQNENGFLTIQYEKQMPSSRGEVFVYKFVLDVEPIKSKKHQESAGYYEYPLPFLDIKFAGYSFKHPLRRQFDIVKMLDERAEELVDYQQQFMPLRFVIIPAKESFNVMEPIRFKVVLMNASEHNILVKGLGQETLFFTLNNKFWGTESNKVEMLSAREQRRRDRALRKEIRARARASKNQAPVQVMIGRKTHVGDEMILRSDEALTIDFSGEGYPKAQDIEIRGIYKRSIKGLRPTSKVTIKIIDEK